jgi:hypothetical protein
VDSGECTSGESRGVEEIFIDEKFLGSGGTGGTIAGVASSPPECTETSLLPLALLPFLSLPPEEGVVDEVGSEVESRDVGVPMTLVEEEDSRLATVSAGLDNLPRAGTAGTSSARSTQLFSGESCILLGFFAGAPFFPAGVPGRLEILVVLVLGFARGVFFPGVELRPSSLRSASSVSGSTALPESGR